MNYSYYFPQPVLTFLCFNPLRRGMEKYHVHCIISILIWHTSIHGISTKIIKAVQHCPFPVGIHRLVVGYSSWRAHNAESIVCRLHHWCGCMGQSVFAFSWYLGVMGVIIWVWARKFKQRIYSFWCLSKATPAFDFPSQTQRDTFFDPIDLLHTAPLHSDVNMLLLMPNRSHPEAMY